MEYYIEDILPFSENRSFFKEKDGYYSLIDDKGKIIKYKEYTGVIGKFENGSCIVSGGEVLKLKRRTIILNPYYYLIDRNGNKISKSYDFMEEFYNGLSRVSKGKIFSNTISFGYIDRSGSEVVKCIYNKILGFEDGKIKVRDFQNEYHYIPYKEPNITNNTESFNESYDENVYNRLLSEYKEVKKYKNLYLVSDENVHDEYDLSFEYGISNEKGELIFPISIRDNVKLVGKNILSVDAFFSKFLLCTKKIDDNDVRSSDFDYGIGYYFQNQLIYELSSDKDFVLIRKNREGYLSVFYLVNKNNLKIKVTQGDIFYYEDGIGHIYDELKKYFRYFDFSEVCFDNVDITNTDFISTNAKINPQTVFNKDFSGVSIIATNLVDDDLITNASLDGIITDENTNIIGKYIDNRNGMKLTLKK